MIRLANLKKILHDPGIAATVDKYAWISSRNENIDFCSTDDEWAEKALNREGYNRKQKAGQMPNGKALSKGTYHYQPIPNGITLPLSLSV